jgi:PKD repeat protein
VLTLPENLVVGNMWVFRLLLLFMVVFLIIPLSLVMGEVQVYYGGVNPLDSIGPVPWSSGPGSTEAGGFSVHDIPESRIHYIKAGGITGFPESAGLSPVPLSDSSLQVDFSGTPTSGNAPLMVSFSDLTKGSQKSWIWDFGDGSTGGDKNIVHTYFQDGNYTVRLTALNQAGATGSMEKERYITVHPAPVPANATALSVPIRANFTASPTSGVAPLTVEFTDHSTGNPTIWEWDFGAGPFWSTTPNPTHEFAFPGTYTVRLTVVNAKGESATTSQAITVTEPSKDPLVLSANFTASPTSGVAPLTVEFTDHSTGNPSIWEWDFGAGPFWGTTPNPTHEFAFPGTYTVRLTVSNARGETSSTSRAITVSEPSRDPQVLSANFSASPTSGVAPLTVEFTDHSTGNPSIWEWDFGAGPFWGTTPNPTHEFAFPGSYTVRLTVSNTRGETSSTSRGITATNPDFDSLHADFVGTPLSGSVPLTVRFADNSTGDPDSYVWDFGDDTTDTTENPSHTYTKYGVYSVKLTVKDLEGNSDTARKANYISTTGVPQPSGSIPVSAGWNFVSVPKKLVSGNDTAVIFRHIDADGHSLMQYDSLSGQWVTLNPTSPIKPLDAVWLYSKKIDSVPLTFDSSATNPPTRQLKKGWNAVGFTGLTPLEAKKTFQSVQDTWLNGLGYNREFQKYDQMIIKGQNDDTKLSPYNGYWLYMADNAVITGVSA